MMHSILDFLIDRNAPDRLIAALHFLMHRARRDLCPRCADESR